MQITNTAKVCETLLIVCKTLLMVAMHGTSLLENGEQTYGKLSEAGYCGVLWLTKEVGGVLRGTVGYCRVLWAVPCSTPTVPTRGYTPGLQYPGRYCGQHPGTVGVLPPWGVHTMR